MSDDLVKRLRRVSMDLGVPSTTTLDSKVVAEAADRIEELEAKLTACEKYRNAYAECDRIGTQSVRELEAKLAKAVEALEFYATLIGEKHECPWHMLSDDFGEKARATLAELTGGKDE